MRDAGNYKLAERLDILSEGPAVAGVPITPANPGTPANFFSPAGWGRMQAVEAYPRAQNIYITLTFGAYKVCELTRTYFGYLEPQTYDQTLAPQLRFRWVE